jgi:hypothetical protein
MISTQTVAIITNHRNMHRDSYFAELLVGGQIDSVLVDSEVTYIMLTNGTQITIRGAVVVQPKPRASSLSASASA